MDFVLPTRGPFSLSKLATFGFGHNTVEEFDGVMRLAFCLDGGYEQQVGVAVRQDGDELQCTAEGSREQRRVAAQVARVLSVDHDGEAFSEVGRRDPVIGRLQQAAPGLRPPQFYSPYEAAVWSIISARRNRRQAAPVRHRLAATYGATFELAGQDVSALPGPSRLLDLGHFPGIAQDRIPRLHAIAKAALAGELEVDHLAAMEPADAMEQLQRLPGIGPFYSSLVVIRACGLADVLPTTEQHLLDLVPRLYDVPTPLSAASFAELAQRWRPFRTWAAVLIRAAGPRVLGDA
jgi:DNA-3-methyladenine glycosylase II